MRLWLFILPFVSVVIHAEVVKVDIECEEPSEKLVDHREMPLFMVRCVKTSAGPPLYHLAECAEPKLSKRLKVGETRIQKETGYSTVIGCIGRTNTTEDYRWYFGPIECIVDGQHISAFPPNNVYKNAKSGKQFTCNAEEMTIQPYHAAETTADPTIDFTVTMRPAESTTVYQATTTKKPVQEPTTKKAEPAGTTKTQEPVTSSTRRAGPTITTTRKAEPAATTKSMEPVRTTQKPVQVITQGPAVATTG